MSETEALFAALHRAAAPDVVERVEGLVRTGADRDLARINALAFASAQGLNETATVATFLQAAKLGVFDMGWGVLCPGCGGVLSTDTTLKVVKEDAYHCALCAAGYQPTLDEMVEVTFTVSPRVRHIAAHNPDTLPPFDYYRQVFFSSGVDLKDDFEQRFSKIQLEMVELSPGEKALLSLQLPADFVIVQDAVTHATQFIDVRGEPTSERQTLSMVISRGPAPNETVTRRPGPLRLAIENRTDRRVIPNVVVAGDELHALLGRRRPFLTAKQLLAHQTFRDEFRTATLDVDQKLKVTSMTFVFTDLKGSTNLYERVGDLEAFDLVRAHFEVLQEIVAAEAGAVVKTVGDAVMATFPTPERAVAAVLRIREAMQRFNRDRGRNDLLLKIGMHEGPCLAVVLNDRQDFFGQTVNIASRVQDLAEPQAILLTEPILTSPRVADMLSGKGLVPLASTLVLKGIDRPVRVYALTQTTDVGAAQRPV